MLRQLIVSVVGHVDHGKSSILDKIRGSCIVDSEAGKITHYYSNIGVAIVEVADTISAGDKIHIQGATSDFEQDVGSLQIEHESVEVAEAGQVIGLKVNEKVRDGDKVFVVEA